MQVGLVHNRRCHPFRNGYEMRVPVAINEEYRCNVQHNEQQNDQQNSQNNQQQNDEHNNQHTGQDNNHGNDQRVMQKLQHLHIKRQDYETIWSLSRVNHQIRKEMGSLFWKNIHLDIDHWEYLFIDFLKDRPAVCKGIKKLRMSWNCDEHPWDLDHTIISFCKYISQHLVLDELLFVLCTTPTIARQILASGGQLAWVQVFRRIVVKTLRVELFLCDDDDEVSDDQDDNSDSNAESEEARYERLANEMNPLMEAMLHPPELELTEENDYLLSRAA
jgi:hypothetical protein